MTFSEFFERYVFVRKCVACSERLGYEYRSEAFCDACRVSFERAKIDSCPECMRAMADCKCLPKRLSNVGVIAHRKLFAYRKNEPLRPENKLVYHLKNYRSKRAADFAACQLSYRLEEILSSENLSKGDAVITFVPRSKRSYARYGVDQARAVAESLGKISGVECLPLLKRLHDGPQQKSLTVKERLKNTAGMFKVDKVMAGEVSSRAVILYDDVVTTGASVCRASQELRRYGFEKIYVLSLASTVNEKR